MIERITVTSKDGFTLDLFGCVDSQGVITAEAIHASKVFKAGKIFYEGFTKYRLLETIPQANFLYAKDINLDKVYTVLRRLA
jgi:hypothetical protein